MRVSSLGVLGLAVRLPSPLARLPGVLIRLLSGAQISSSSNLSMNFCFLYSSFLSRPCSRCCCFCCCLLSFFVVVVVALVVLVLVLVLVLVVVAVVVVVVLTFFAAADRYCSC